MQSEMSIRDKIKEFARKILKRNSTESAEKSAHPISYVSRIINPVDYDMEVFITDDGKYMDILQIICKDLMSASKDTISFDEACFEKLYKTATFDMKIVSLNFPTDTSRQQEYYKNKIESCRNEVFLIQLKEKLAELERITKYRTDREYYLIFFAENMDQYNDNYNTIMRALSRGTVPLIRKMSMDKKEAILFKMNNKSAMIGYV